MALTTIQPIDGFGYVPVLLGDFGQEQSVTEQETTNELIGRGFMSQAEVVPVSPPVSPKVVPTIGREDAIKRGVDDSLDEFKQPRACNRSQRPGGCPIREATFKRIAQRSAVLATRYLRQGAITPRAPVVTPVPGGAEAAFKAQYGRFPWEMTAEEAQRIKAGLPVSPAPVVRAPVSPVRLPAVSPLPALSPALSPAVSPAAAGTARQPGESDIAWTQRLLRMGISAREALMIRLRERGGTIQRYTLRGLSPRLRGIASNLYGLGQAQAPEMTRWDWIGIVASAASGVATTLEAYANARAERERAGQTATLTADQIKAVVQTVLAENPQLSKAAVEAAALGAGGKAPAAGMPGWVIPAMVGTAVIAFMSMRRR